MPPVGFEPTVSAGERPQTYALDRAATGTDSVYLSEIITKATEALREVFDRLHARDSLQLSQSLQTIVSDSPKAWWLSCVSPARQLNVLYILPTYLFAPSI